MSFELTAEQNEVLDNIKNFLSGNVIIDEKVQKSMVLSGPAGTGKTTILRQLRGDLKDYTFTYLAPTHKACHVLKKSVEDEVHTTLVALGFTMDYDNKGVLRRVLRKTTNSPLPKPTDKTVLVIDEASMLDKKIFTMFEKLDHKKIYVGDIHQLGPIDDDGHSLVFDLPYILELNTIMRSTNKRILNVNKYFREKVESNATGKEVLSELRKKKSIKTNNYIREKIKEKLLNVEDLNIITFSNKKKDTWNDFCRSILSEIYDSDDEWLPGMKIMINSTFMYYENYMEIKDNNVEFRNIAYQTEQGENLHSCQELIITDVRRSVIPPNEYFETTKDLIVYTITCKYIDCDVSFTFNKMFNEESSKYFERKRNEKKKSLNNQIDLMKNSIYFKKKEISLLWKEYYTQCNNFDANIEFAMAITSHKSQGSTFKNVFVDITNMAYVPAPDDTKKRSMYVGISRSKDDLFMF